MFQMSFASIRPKNKNIRAEQFLSEMRQVVPWKRISRLLKPHYYANQTGRPAYDLILMIKVHCLQQWYNLGDLAMEEAVYDSILLPIKENAWFRSIITQNQGGFK